MVPILILSKHTFTLEPYDLNILTKISNTNMLGLVVFVFVFSSFSFLFCFSGNQSSSK